MLAPLLWSRKGRLLLLLSRGPFPQRLSLVHTEIDECLTLSRALL
jgi:hypothetical protein